MGSSLEGQRRAGKYSSEFVFRDLLLGKRKAESRNLSQISQLYNSVLPLSPLQTQITSSLDYIESQQKELSDVLDSYEKEIGDLVDQSATGAGWRGGSGAGSAEREREKA